MEFAKKVQNFVFQERLWDRNSRILVAVSGGPDSTCLLSLLAYLKRKYALELHICHVNYGLRGNDSDGDEEFVRQLAKEYGLTISVLNAKKALNKGNLEDNLRKIRYAFLEKECQKLGFDAIAVAHNQDDQVETMLMRVLRGSGLNGMSSMKPKTGKIIRPLLKTSRAEIMAYLKENKLKYRIDKSNADTNFLRNKIRHKLLPYLEKEYNPSIKSTISGTVAFIAEDYAFIDLETEKQFKRILNKKNGTVLEFSSKKLLALSPALVLGVLRKAIGEVKGDLFDIESAHIEEILKMLKSDKSKRKNVSFKGLNIHKKGDIVSISL